jgi:hypothetical protein
MAVGVFGHAVFRDQFAALRRWRVLRGTACCAPYRASPPPGWSGDAREIDRPLAIVSKRLVHGRIGTLDPQRPHVAGGGRSRADEPDAVMAIRGLLR